MSVFSGSGKRTPHEGTPVGLPLPSAHDAYLHREIHLDNVRFPPCTLNGKNTAGSPGDGHLRSVDLDRRPVAPSENPQKPDVVVMALMMPNLDGDGATERILKANPSAKVLILTLFGIESGVAIALKKHLLKI